MNKPLNTWLFILNHLQQNIPVMLLYVLESKGSSPGRQGFFMAVTAGGLMEGSIGGGVMEYKFVELAKEKLVQQQQELSVRKQIHDKAAARNQSGMICSGEQTILLYTTGIEDLSAIRSVIISLQQHEKGRLQLSPAGLHFQSGLLPVNDFQYYINSEQDWLYEEKTGFKNDLYIIGGGHCALALSKIMCTMDFCIHSFEDRKGLNTFEQNTYVHKKTLVTDYSELMKLIPSGGQCYVVIMTFGYRSDDLAVRALLKKNFAYFGLLGSAAKIARMFSGYRNEGIEEMDLQKIHAPVGLPINSQTPEEIAVSIAAQIIQVKNALR